MMTIAVYILAALVVMLLVVLGFSLFYMLRFAQYVMIIENDFSDAIDSLDSLEELLEAILKMRMFFDSPEVQLAVQKTLQQLKEAKIEVGRVTARFVERSKKKFTVVVEEGNPQVLNSKMRAANRELAIENGEFTEEVGQQQ